MKIVSLQSVTNESEFALNEIVYDKMLVIVGDGCLKKQRDGSFKPINSIPKVTEINYQQGDFDAYGFEIYTVHTSDGHIRVLPADKYIAEWGE
ncbi:hypothetical protein J3326_02065 [Leuconostoc mesenteroides]|uniref:hypothetical protein n=1 Tax=Leuconostoc mesenteroides TaxID=1245 RepID=UPI001CBB2602|nr:hypothetical protein [Leuconostoc mesenteroides]MBZ1515972.1 hypothetical protein [Leuconostoc mesenteroides]